MAQSAAGPLPGALRPPDPMLDAAASLQIASDHLALSGAVASLRTAADCLMRSAIPEAVASLRAAADSLETRLDSPPPTRKRPPADAASDLNSPQQPPATRQRPASAARRPATGERVREGHMASLQFQELEGRDRFNLVREATSRYHFPPDECAWGNGIITFETRCMDPKCPGSGRIHCAREPLTPAQRWGLFQAASVTHYHPAP